MPSPIAHLGVGYAIYRSYKRRVPEIPGQLWNLPFQMIMIIGLSLLPDLDVIAAIIFRDMENYHNNLSHSFLVAIPVGLLVAAIFRQIYQSSFWLWFLICSISYDVHILMDALTSPRGVRLFWPVSPDRFVSPIRIFYGLQWDLGWFSLSHLWTVMTESVFVVVLMMIVNHFDKRRKTKTVRSQES